MHPFVVCSTILTTYEHLSANTIHNKKHDTNLPSSFMFTKLPSAFAYLSAYLAIISDRIYATIIHLNSLTKIV